MPRFSNRPNGNCVLLPIVLVTAAFALSNAAGRWCDFLYRTNLRYDARYAFLGNASTDIGMWSYELGGGGACAWYPTDLYLDVRFNSARVFGNWTVIAGGIMMIVIWFSACCGLGRLGWGILGFLLLVNCLFEGLVFLILTSAICDPNFATCSLAWGSRCGISAVVFWFLAAVSVNSVPAPEGLVEEEESSTVAGAETVRTTTTETVHPDGTKTVTTTTETTTTRV